MPILCSNEWTWSTKKFFCPSANAIQHQPTCFNDTCSMKAAFTCKKNKAQIHFNPWWPRSNSLCKVQSCLSSPLSAAAACLSRSLHEVGKLEMSVQTFAATLHRAAQAVSLQSVNKAFNLSTASMTPQHVPLWQAPLLSSYCILHTLSVELSVGQRQTKTDMPFYLWVRGISNHLGNTSAPKSAFFETMGGDLIIYL